jgi:hypothetical protein
MEYPDLPELPLYGFSPDLGGLLGLLVTFVLPLAVGVLTKQSWGTGTKGTVLLLLSAIKSIVEAWLMAVNTGVDFEFVPTVYTTVVNFMIAVALYFGWYRGTPIQRAAAGAGVTDGPVGGDRHPDHR